MIGGVVTNTAGRGAFQQPVKMGHPIEGRRREIGMQTVIRTMFVVFLLLVGIQIPFQRVVPSLSAANPSLPPLIATEQEVRAFINRYIDRYNQREIEEFLSLFSLGAKQNQRDGLPEIRMIYSGLFNRSKSLELSVEDVKIEIYQNVVEIKARFSVNQVLKEGEGKKIWKGNARWILGREEEKLQILSVDYEYSIPPSPSGEMMPEPLPLLAKEEEIQQFFSDYTDRYHQKDINGFLSFFSPKAIQNQKENLEEIKSIYTQFFDESRKLRYQIEGMQTEIYQNRIEVKARFRIDQTLKKGNKEKVWNGNVRWVLSRDDGVLKILSLDYQNEKSP
jgi:ketosteroid isomerase-like protein